MRPEWTDFVGGKWQTEINVRDFIQKNYHPYDGDDDQIQFLTELLENVTQEINEMLELKESFDYNFLLQNGIDCCGSELIISREIKGNAESEYYWTKQRFYVKVKKVIKYVSV